MAQKTNNGQKSASPLKNIIFGSAQDFANKGICFEGNSMVVDDAVTYAKGAQVNGVWLGNDAMITMLSIGATRLLESTVLELDDSADDEAQTDLLFVIGNCIQSIRFSYLMKGLSPKKAKQNTVDFVMALDLDFAEDVVLHYLDIPFFAV